MRDPLDEATIAWFSLLERQETDAALDLFCTRIVPELLPVLRARFVQDHPRGGGDGRYDGLISLLGFTPDTSILAARFTGARRVALLHTAETERFVADVRAFAGLAPEDVLAVPFDRHHLEDVERAFADALSLFADARSLAVEQTGGTKPMSTALHVVAALSDVDTLYLDYDQYDPRYRKPVPASIRVRRMESPLRRASTGAGAGQRLLMIHGGLQRLARELTGAEHALPTSLREQMSSLATDALRVGEAVVEYERRQPGKA